MDTVSSPFTPFIDSITDLIDDWPDFDGLPLVGGIFIYSNLDMAPTQWRVLSIKEENGTEYAITALSYNSSKYDYIERGKKLDVKTYVPPFSDVAQVNAPENVSATGVTSDSSGQTTDSLIVSWQDVPNAVSYEVNYRLIE
mgnify:CR=1 FL=1